MATPIAFLPQTLPQPAATTTAFPIVRPERTSGALVLNINAPLSNVAGDTAPSTGTGSPQPPGPENGDIFQRRPQSGMPSIPNPFAPPEQQLLEAYNGALISRNDAEQARNSYLNLANQLNGQAYQYKYSQQPTFSPAPQPQAFATPMSPSPWAQSATMPQMQNWQSAQQQVAQQQAALQQKMAAAYRPRYSQGVSPYTQSYAQGHTGQPTYMSYAQRPPQSLYSNVMPSMGQQSYGLPQSYSGYGQSASAYTPDYSAYGGGYAQSPYNNYAQAGYGYPQQNPYDPMSAYAAQQQNPYDPMSFYGQQQNPYDPMSAYAGQQQNPYDPMSAYAGQQQNPYDPMSAYAGQQQNPYINAMAQQQPMPQEGMPAEAQGLSGESIAELNDILAQPQTPAQDRLNAINEISMRQQGDPQTYELLKREIMNKTPQPGLTADDANLMRQSALFALGTLNRQQNANTPVSMLPGMGAINRVLNDKAENPAVRAAAIRALGLIDYPGRPVSENPKQAKKDRAIIPAMLDKALKDKNPDVRNAAMQAKSGAAQPMFPPAEGQQAGGAMLQYA